VLTAARFLGEAGRLAGLEVVLSQLHGMSRWGGNVRSTVIFGGHSSAFIEDGAADIVLGLEPLEVLRARPKMSARTMVVTNLGVVVPQLLAQRGETYPDLDRTLAEIRAVIPDLVAIDGLAIAMAAGARRSLNVVMLGVLASLDLLPFNGDTLWTAVERYGPARHLEANRRAFGLGREAVTT
jgi:indolepyruvate ferredoxin oxidoreductase beta subunit